LKLVYQSNKKYIQKQEWLDYARNKNVTGDYMDTAEIVLMQ